MILFPLARDKARMIEKNFLPYMVLLALSKLQQAGETPSANPAPFRDSTYINCKIILSLIQDVEKIFKRKLLTEANKFTFKLTDAQGIAFYYFLMNHPIEESQVFANVVRQQLCDLLHHQFYEPVQVSDNDENF